jgi:hypothetical protein
LQLQMREEPFDGKGSKKEKVVSGKEIVFEGLK